MSLNGYEFKPIMLILGVLLFIGLSIPLLLAYGCLYMKYTLLEAYNNIKENNKSNKNIGLKGV